MTCAHPEAVLGKLDCGAGGVQIRRYCRACWCASGPAIPHGRFTPDEIDRMPWFDRDVLDRAQTAAWQRYRLTGSYARPA